MSNILIEQTSSKDFLYQIGELIENKVNELFPDRHKKSEEDSTTFLTIKETAKLLDISKSSVYNYTLNGQLKAHRIGNTTRYIKSEVMNSLNQES